MGVRHLRGNISRVMDQGMWGIRTIVAAVALFAPALARADDVITALPTSEKVIALTFDACEQGKPVAFDRAVLDYLLDQRIPFTVFVTGRFVQSNLADVTERSEEHTSELQSHVNLVCRLLLEKKKKQNRNRYNMYRSD